ncbi:MAG: hypothetical protein R6V85_20525 [Polyangia bacterium]
MKRSILIVFVVLASLAASAAARADTDRKLTYRASQIWNSAVRFLRVDQGFEVLEKDDTAGYLLFEYEDRGRTYSASMEVVPLVYEGRELVRVRLRVSGMPSYVEVMLLDKFQSKLKDEYGRPPAARLVEVAVAQKSNARSKSGHGSATGGEQAENEGDLEVDEQDLEGSSEKDD